MVRFFSFLLILLVLISCSNDKKHEVDVSGIVVDFSVRRFEQDFYTANESSLQDVKKNYPLFFPSGISDTTYISKIHNEENQYLFEETKRVFGDFSEQKSQLSNLFKHIKYYNPKFKEPNVITTISDLDYEYPVIYADSLLLISLDMFLGSDNIVYKDFPQYLAQNYTREHLIVAVSNDIINQSFPKYKSRSFLDYLINEGRYRYLSQLFLPSVSEANIMGYTEKQQIWVENNEMSIWKYFVENELLYSREQNLLPRFVNPAPFSKFYMDIDQQSPGQVGVWVGLQIIKSYMNNNDVTLRQLLQANTEEIFTKSKYKPKK